MLGDSWIIWNRATLFFFDKLGIGYLSFWGTCVVRFIIVTLLAGWSLLQLIKMECISIVKLQFSVVHNWSHWNLSKFYGKLLVILIGQGFEIHDIQFVLYLRAKRRLARDDELGGLSKAWGLFKVHHVQFVLYFRICLFRYKMFYGKWFIF